MKFMGPKISTYKSFTIKSTLNIENEVVIFKMTYGCKLINVQYSNVIVVILYELYK